jgi:hypothetical protein
MTPTEEVRFIELWQQGLESAEIARQLGIPRGTVSSRAATLVRPGENSAPASGRRLSEAAGQGPAGPGT